MFEEMLTQFLVYLEQDKKLSANTLPNYESHIREFLNFLRERNIRIDNVDRAIIKDFLLTLHERKLKRQTIHIKVLMIKSFFNYCEMKCWVRTSDLPPIKVPLVELDF